MLVHGAREKKVSRRPRKPDGRAQGACGSREACGCGLPSYLPGPSRWRWQCGPRARDHVAGRWLHRPVFFSLACRHRRRVSTHGPPCRLLERSAEARALVTRNGRGAVNCEKTVHEHIHKPVHGCNSKLASKPIEFWVTYGFYSVYTLNQ